MHQNRPGVVFTVNDKNKKFERYNYWGYIKIINQDPQESDPHLPHGTVDDLRWLLQPVFTQARQQKGQ